MKQLKKIPALLLAVLLTAALAVPALAVSDWHYDSNVSSTVETSAASTGTADRTVSGSSIRLFPAGTSFRLTEYYRDLHGQPGELRIYREKADGRGFEHVDTIVYSNGRSDAFSFTPDETDVVYRLETYEGDMYEPMETTFYIMLTGSSSGGVTREDKLQVTQSGSSVTFYNPSYGYSLTLSGVVSYEDIEMYDVVSQRLYHLVDDGSAKATVRNIDSEYTLFGYDFSICGYDVKARYYSANFGGGLFVKAQQCAPGSEVSWTFGGTDTFYDVMFGTEEWMAPYHYYMFPSAVEVSDDSYNYINFYDVYFVTDGGRVSYTNHTIDGVSFDNYLARARAASAVGGFSDVRSTDYFADAVLWAVNHNPQITNGMGDGQFGSSSTVTRAQAVTFLWRAANMPEPASMASSFSDVKDAGSWYYKAVLWAKEQGITNGNSATGFGVDDPLSYEQMLTFMARAAGADTSGDWSAKAQDWAKVNGLTDGVSFSAKGNCPRSDTVYFLWKEFAE